MIWTIWLQIDFIRYWLGCFFPESSKYIGDGLKRPWAEQSTHAPSTVQCRRDEAMLRIWSVSRRFQLSIHPPTYAIMLVVKQLQHVQNLDKSNKSSISNISNTSSLFQQLQHFQHLPTILNSQIFPILPFVHKTLLTSLKMS